MQLKLIEAEIKAGYVVRQSHPTLPISIYNYTPAVQFEGRWNTITRACRGLVLENKTGEVIARPWPKFFNLSELAQRGEVLPTLPWEATDKMDGSLGIVFWYADRWHMATRGSFESEQSIVGAELLSQLDMRSTPKDTTLLFEIIYPENRIVVDYGGVRKLVLIGATTGVIDWDHAALSGLAGALGCEVTPLASFGDGPLPEFPERINAEGYVVRYSNGFRVKIKHDEYVRLHAILTRVSSRTIWEFLRDRRPIEDMLYAVPDEFHDWVRETERHLRLEYAKVLAAGFVEVTKCRRESRKETALAWKDRGCRVPSSVFFGLLDGKDVRDHIWRLIRPDFDRPFSFKRAA